MLEQFQGCHSQARGDWGRKKSLHAQERDTEANRQRREEFHAAIAATPPEKLKFLNESGVTTQMTRLWGRAPPGERVHEATLDGRWQVLTTLGTMRLRGIDAIMTVASATDGDVLRAYVEQVLCATLQPGDVLILDNLSAHNVARHSGVDRGPGRATAVSAALLAGPESHRAGLVQVQTVPARGKGTRRRGPRPNHHRSTPSKILS
jgi:hypothetical protein